VHITSRLGEETVELAGTATVDRGDPYMDGGVLVIDTEIIAMDLAGDSLTGPVTVVESGTLASNGEIRGLQAAPQQYPASSFFDAYIVATVPASPDPTIDLHNDVPIQLTGQPVYGWPPTDAMYSAQPIPCIPLLPSQPAQACLDSMSFNVSGPAGVGGMTRLAAPFVDESAGANLSAVAAIAAGGATLFAAAVWSVRRRARARQ
jgi:hypothetical protein